MSPFVSVLRILKVCQKMSLMAFFFALLIVAFSGSAQAATFALSPSSGSFTQGCDVSLDILIDTQGISSNAADAILFYDPNDVEFIDQDANMPQTQVSKGNVYQIYAGNIADDAEGKVLLTGFNVLGGFNGSGIYGSLVFRSKPGVTNTQFTFDFTPGGSTDSNIADMTSSDVLSGVTSGSYTFSPGSCVPDTQAPQITQFLPAFGADDVPLSTNLSFHVTDDQSGVDMNTLSVIAHNTTFTNGSPEMTVTGTALDFTVVINPANDFPFNTEIVTTIGVRDVSGNIMPQRVFRFNAPDAQPPNIINVNPANGARDIPLASNVNFRLTDNDTGIDTSTLSLTLNGESFSNTSPQVSISGTPLSQDVVVNPDDDFPFNTQITLVVSVSDLGGNVMTPKTFSFNAPDQVAPSVINMSPANGAGGIALDSSFTFNLVDNDTGVDLTTVLLNLQGADFGPSSPLVGVSGTNLNYAITLNPSTDFLFGQNITLRISAADLGGNLMIPQTFTFNTGAAPPVCGNAVTESGEACDDGNAIETDGCLADCTRGALCGDKRVEGTEQCEPPGSLVCDEACNIVFESCLVASAPTFSSGGGGSVVFTPLANQISKAEKTVSDQLSEISMSIGLKKAPAVVGGVELNTIKTSTLVCADSELLREIREESISVPYDPPEGFSVIGKPFSIACVDGVENTTLSVPQNYLDVEAFRCTDGECFSTEIQKTEVVTCGDELLSQTVTRERFDGIVDIGKLDLPRELSQYSAIVEDRYLSVSLFEDGFDVPLHPSLVMVSSPVVIASADDMSLVQLSFPAVTDPRINEESLQLYAYLSGTDKWQLVDGQVELQRDGDQISVSGDLTQYQDDNSTMKLVLMGLKCVNKCKERSFEKVYEPFRTTRAAIVLVHGLGSDNSSWGSFIDQIRRTQQPFQVWTYHYPVEDSLNINGSDLASQLENSADEYDALYIVGHYTGGLVAQEAINTAFRQNLIVPETYRFIPKINHVITLGTPEKSYDSEAPLLTLYEELMELDEANLFYLSDDLKKDLIGKRFFYPQLPTVDYSKIIVSERDDISQNAPIPKWYESLSSLEPQETVFEVPTSQINMLSDPLSQKMLGQLISRDIREYITDQALLGYEQYYNLRLSDCAPSDQVILIGRKVDPLYMNDGVGMSCGNGYCGLDESSDSCPIDCARFFRKENTSYLLFFLLVLFTAGFGFAMRKSWARYQNFQLESEMKPYQKLSSFQKFMFFVRAMGVWGVACLLFTIVLVYLVMLVF
ncbi:MAG: Ig-like domain-containing protein [Candidatus Gracilibacteria bacterium]|nr:Ig-like domain-containing protein [Candidatus Gracilibacteria bacterium]